MAKAKKSIVFPDGFLWGTAVCSHQADGHNENSDWWAWEKKGKIYDGTVSGAAADMLNRYPEDFELMEKLGYNAFRLSVEWARIEPKRGQYSEEGLAHIENVLKELRKRNIKACLTLYHWVLPKWVADDGGWVNRENVERFRAFVEKVVERVYDDVDIWVTLNEPTAPLFAGYVLGEFPPEKRNPVLAVKVFKNLLRAHAAAYAVIMAESARRGETEKPVIGIAMALAEVESSNPDNPLDRGLHEMIKFLHNDAFIDACQTGRVPFPFGVNEKIEGLAGSFTFVGVNYYTRFRFNIKQKKMPRELTDFLYLPEGIETTAMGYEVYPPGFYNILKEMSKFGVPIYVTENGIADETDEQRPGYLLRHLAQVKRAIDDGIDVRGYFQWSYIDNFEWRFGFVKRLGLVTYDPVTFERETRPSAYMYGDIAKKGRITPALARKYAPEVVPELWGDE